MVNWEKVAHDELHQRLKLEEAIRRVRDRHRKLTHTRTTDGSKYDYCAECLDYPTYPCATIKDLDGPATLPPEKEPK